MQIGQITGGGAAGIDHHHSGVRARFFRGDHALVQHRMGPGGVGAHQHQQLGAVQILIAAGHAVAAEGALVAGHRRRHAEPAVGVHVGAADKAFHQLIGDVIVLGEQLPGAIAGHAVGAVFHHGVAQPPRHFIQRAVPIHHRAVHFRVQQPVVMVEGFMERSALYTKTPLVGRVVRHSGHAVAGAVHGHTATHAAVRAGGVGGVNALGHGSGTGPV